MWHWKNVKGLWGISFLFQFCRFIPRKLLTDFHLQTREFHNELLNFITTFPIQSTIAYPSYIVAIFQFLFSLIYLNETELSKICMLCWKDIHSITNKKNWFITIFLTKRINFTFKSKWISTCYKLDLGFSYVQKKQLQIWLL